jgi:hypothetical protein
MLGSVYSDSPRCPEVRLWGVTPPGSPSQFSRAQTHCATGFQAILQVRNLAHHVSDHPIGVAIVVGNYIARGNGKWIQS